MWEQVLVALDSEDAHSRNGARGAFFSKRTIFPKRDFLVGIKGLEAPNLFLVTFKPHFTVRVGIRKSFQKGGRALFVKIKGTDERSHRVEGRLLWGNGRAKK